MKKFVEDDYQKILATADQKEAKELKVSVEQVQKRRENHFKRNKKLISASNMVLLSDEMSGGDSTGEGSSATGGSEDVPRVPAVVERPGNAQYLETPSVTMPIDLSGVSSEFLFGKRKEVYRLKAHKLDDLVEC